MIIREFSVLIEESESTTPEFDAKVIKALLKKEGYYVEEVCHEDTYNY